MHYRPGADEHPHIDRDEVLRFLGYAGQQLDDELVGWMEDVIAGLERDICPQGLWRVFAVDASGTDGDGMPCIALAGSSVVLQGRDIYRHLKDARWCALLACTLGAGCERELRTLSAQQPARAVVYDAAASAYAEAAVRAMDAQVRERVAALGLSANWRFSCGYGDCPLDAQGQILATLDAGRRLGLTVTRTMLMVPSKSVTAMIGLFEGQAHAADDARPSCATCRVRAGCAFRARGLTCYGSGDA